MSLAHAFTYAGVPSTVMSLWQVSDASTADLLTDFYKNLKDGVPKDFALQQAKLSYLNSVRAPEQAHPFFWAALLSYGNQDAIEFSNRLPTWVLVVSGIGLFFVLFVLTNVTTRK